MPPAAVFFFFLFHEENGEPSLNADEGSCVQRQTRTRPDKGCETHFCAFAAASPSIVLLIQTFLGRRNNICRVGWERGALLVTCCPVGQL